mgnify:CR=1 FL=1
MGFIVAVDGTITKIIAKKLNLVSIDTGAMYRCVALECINQGIEYTEIEEIKKVLENISIELRKENENQLVFLNGKDVTEDIRTPEVDSQVAKFAAIKEVREKITPMQRKMGENNDIIMEGRDIGTVVFPNADAKVFLDCSVEERAMRRYKQDLEKGIQTTYDEVLASIKERHRLETEREIAPLTKAPDAVYIDSTGMTIEEEVDAVIKVINEKRGMW